MKANAKFGSNLAALLCAAAMLPMAAEAADVYYRWKTAGDGNWNDKANWEYSSSSSGPWADLSEDIAVPNGNTSIVTFPVQNLAYTITFQEDVQVKQLTIENDPNPNTNRYKHRPIFDLKGHKFTDSYFTNDNVLQIYGFVSGSDDGLAMDYGPVCTFRNGRLVVARQSGRLMLGASGANRGGAYVFDNATFTGRFQVLRGKNKIYIENGSIVTNTTEFIVCNQESNTQTYKTMFPRLCVRGVDSMFYCAYSAKFTNEGAGLYAMDGGYVNVSNLVVGAAHTGAGMGIYNATNCFAFATNGTIKVWGDLEVGSDYEKCGGTYLKIMGKNGVIMQTETYGKLKIYENTGAHIDIAIPENGFADDADVVRAPLQANDIEFIARDAGKTQGDTFKLNVAGAADWLNAHSKEKLVLVEIATSNPTVLERIKNAVASDVDGSKFMVASGGKKLVLAKPSGLVVFCR